MLTMENPAGQSGCTVDDPRWTAVRTRDGTADGQFYYAVCTTGVYCRPSCSARTPRPQNVRFFASAQEAERAGFRACKRCKPDQLSAPSPHIAKVTLACRAIEASETMPRLEELARLTDMSPYHFHRVFKKVTGLTPRAYGAAQREKRLRKDLGKAVTVTQAIYAAGYNSNSRFYENADSVLGMKPSHYRNGGATLDIRFAVGECSLGSILVAQSEVGVCAILMGDDPDMLVRDLQDRFPHARLLGGDAGFERLIAQVVGFVDAPAVGLDLPLDIRGTAFQQRVWQALRDIAPGSTATYSEIAAAIGAPGAARAVALACAANPLAVAIPCHRVVRNDGSLSGYRWGVERKRALLDVEARDRRNREEQ